MLYTYISNCVFQSLVSNILYDGQRMLLVCSVCTGRINFNDNIKKYVYLTTFGI